jgi:uroporphyrin-III C-methyltransferase/precorrin-2 dehydrogenase/sirohydrochlorin ferrochelatase
VDYLPLFVRLKDRSVLVVGGGEIAARKVALLCRAGAAVHIVAPELGEQTRNLLEEHGLSHAARTYRSEDIADAALVVSATDDDAVNLQVFEDCVAAGKLVNSVDRPDRSNVIFPSLVDRSPVIVAVSTGGASPTLARVVRGWLEARLPSRLGALAGFVRERREAVGKRLATVADRQRFWDRVANGPVAERVLAGDEAAAAVRFDEELETSADAETSGWVALVGAGPGDPELLTLKAMRLLQSADVVLYDNLVNRAILDYARRDAELTYVGKKWRAPSTRQESINALMVEEAQKGRAVVRLKGGDPFIFGRGGEEVEALVAAGVEVVAVPGVTAATGAASYAGIPLTYRDISQSVRFVTGHRAANRTNLDWPELAKPHQTVVLYMGLPGLDDILSALIEHGRAPDTPAALVEKATLPEQKVVVGTLSDLGEKVRAAEVAGPTMIIVGEVVSFRATQMGGTPSSTFTVTNM